MPDEPTPGSASTGGPSDEQPSSQSPAPDRTDASSDPTEPAQPAESTASGPSWWPHAQPSTDAPRGQYGPQGGPSGGHPGGQAGPQGQGQQGPYGQPGPYGSEGVYGQPGVGQPDPYGHQPEGQHGPQGQYGPQGQFGRNPYEQSPAGGYGPQGQYGRNPYDQSPAGGYGQPAQGSYGQPHQGGYAPQGDYGQAPQGGYGQPAAPGYGPQGSYGPGPYGGYGTGQQPPYQGYNWPYVPPRPKRSPEEQRKRNRRAAGFLAVFIAFLGVGILIGSLIAPANPTTVADALVTRTVTAVTQAGSYHYVDLATLVGVSDDITGDAGPSGGRQVISERCESGTNVFDLRLVKGVVYFRGNSPAVVDQLGVAQAKAQADVDKWVKVTKGETPYTSFSDGISTKSNISQLKTTLVPRTSSSNNHATTKVLGYLRLSKTQWAGKAALLVATGTSLPRTLTGDATVTGGRYTVSWTFSHFHEKLNVTAPAHTVPYSSLHATKPSASACG